MCSSSSRPARAPRPRDFSPPWLELPGFADRLAAWSELAGLRPDPLGTTGRRRRDPGHRGRPAPAGGRGHRGRGGARATRRTPARRAQRRRAGRRRHRRDHHRRGRDAPGPGPRPRRMAAAACDTEQTGMTAVLGGNEEDVLAAIADARPHPGQRQRRRSDRRGRHAGQLAAFAADPPAQGPAAAAVGGRRVPHAHMAPAVDALAATAAQACPPRTPASPLLSNPDGAVVTEGRDWLERIVGQVARRSGGTSACRPWPPRRHRHDRAAARRHADRAGPARAARGRAARPEDARRPGGRPGRWPPSTDGTGTAERARERVERQRLRVRATERQRGGS